MKQLEQTLQFPDAINNTHQADENTRYCGGFFRIRTCLSSLHGQAWLAKEVRKTTKQPTYKLVCGFIPWRSGEFKEEKHWVRVWEIQTKDTTIDSYRLWWLDEIRMNTVSDLGILLTTELINAVFCHAETEVKKLKNKITDS